jgi:hypothetical protein
MTLTDFHLTETSLQIGKNDLRVRQDANSLGPHSGNPKIIDFGRSKRVMRLGTTNIRPELGPQNVQICSVYS